MSLSDLLRTSLRGVSANKLRAVLTMLGIIIGVASVIAMLALGNGARAAVESRFRSLGANQVQISTQMAFDNDELVTAGKELTYEDGLLMPGEVELVSRVDMSINAPVKARFGRATLDLTVLGVTGYALESAVSAGEVQPVNRGDTAELLPVGAVHADHYTSESTLCACESRRPATEGREPPVAVRGRTQGELARRRNRHAQRGTYGEKT